MHHNPQVKWTPPPLPPSNKEKMKKKTKKPQISLRSKCASYKRSRQKVNQTLNRQCGPISETIPMLAAHLFQPLVHQRSQSGNNDSPESRVMLTPIGLGSYNTWNQVGKYWSNKSLLVTEKKGQYFAANLCYTPSCLTRTNSQKSGNLRAWFLSQFC